MDADDKIEKFQALGELEELYKQGVCVGEGAGEESGRSVGV